MVHLHDLERMLRPVGTFDGSKSVVSSLLPITTGNQLPLIDLYDPGCDRLARWCGNAAVIAGQFEVADQLGQAGLRLLEIKSLNLCGDDSVLFRREAVPSFGEAFIPLLRPDDRQSDRPRPDPRCCAISTGTGAG